MNTLQNKIFDAIAPAYASGTFTWKDIVDAINASDVKIPAKGWMQVRNVMAAINDMNGFKRTDDIHTETYTNA